MMAPHRQKTTETGTTALCFVLSHCQIINVQVPVLLQFVLLQSPLSSSSTRITHYSRPLHSSKDVALCPASQPVCRQQCWLLSELQHQEMYNKVILTRVPRNKMCKCLSLQNDDVEHIFVTLLLLCDLSVCQFKVHYFFILNTGFHSKMQLADPDRGQLKDEYVSIFLVSMNPNKVQDQNQQSINPNNNYCLCNQSLSPLNLA